MASSVFFVLLTKLIDKFKLWCNFLQAYGIMSAIQSERVTYDLWANLKIRRNYLKKKKKGEQCNVSYLAKISGPTDN